MAKKADKKKKAESQYFIVRKIRKVTCALSERYEKLNDKYVKSARETGREFTDGIKKDFKILVEKATEKGKDMIPEIAISDTLGKRVNTGVKKIAKVVDLPSNADMEKLTGAMESLNRKIDVLAQRYSV